MKSPLKRLMAATFCLLACAGAAVASTPPTGAVPPFPCAAFARNAAGGWKVKEPAILTLSGRLVTFIVGTDFAAGTKTYGFAMPVILDRECGNPPLQRVAAPPR
jgi:hypothetical protein